MTGRERAGTPRFAPARSGLPSGPVRGLLGGPAGDIIAAAVLTGLFLLASGHNGPPKGGRAVDAVGDALLVLAGLSVALCRRYPRTALILVTIVLGCYLGRRYPDGPVYLAGMLALFSLGWHASRRGALTGAGTLVVTLTVVAAVWRGAGLTVLPLIFAGWAAAAVLLGEALRSRRVYLDGVRERTRNLELTRAEQGRRRTAEDRLRIARDLHDSVGHAMAMINVQAGAGAHVADQRPDAAKQALVAIQQASGDVLDELTAMLSVLRADGELAERAPAPGIAQIRQLVDASRSEQLRADVTVEGPADSISETVGVAAYRIVQESLTNVIRHAGATHVQVTVRASADRGLLIEVRDDGAGASPSSAGSGTGIRGMRERAESSGGQLEAAAGPDGGFVVRACWRPRP
jgi:signal transduction histidine kinase